MKNTTLTQSNRKRIPYYAHYNFFPFYDPFTAEQQFGGGIYDGGRTVSFIAVASKYIFPNYDQVMHRKKRIFVEWLCYQAVIELCNVCRIILHTQLFIVCIFSFPTHFFLRLEVRSYLAIHCKATKHLFYSSL